MKKVIFILALVFALGAIKAQDFTVYKAGTPTTIITYDSITNTGADTVDILIKLPSNEKFWNVAAMMHATAGTGTADIDVTYQGGMDGSRFYTLATDSLASGNLSYIYNNTAFQARYLRIIYTGVGTQKTYIRGWLYIGKN
jgi:hypothetical protein